MGNARAMALRREITAFSASRRSPRGGGGGDWPPMPVAGRRDGSGYNRYHVGDPGKTMPRCPSCQTESPATNRFCGQCGAALAPRCPQCGAEVAAGNRFCGQCGANVQAAGAPAPPADAYTPRHLAEKILRSRSALEGERRQVTVLFADLAGFTRLAEKLDPEDVHAIVDRCFELITAEVHRFEGTINQYTGDGVMAIFGAPSAH
jgi:hypothetical protein